RKVTPACPAGRKEKAATPKTCLQQVNRTGRQTQFISTTIFCVRISGLSTLALPAYRRHPTHKYS
ncbi:MAG: hypothetical protein H7Y04_04290, partial [Verrucomicrobia bacterium]|nr:hypothetical protein [Cytophagales bacterium]